MGDGTYTVTYVVPKRGNYMVNVECNGKPIMGSPFPVFFSAGLVEKEGSEESLKKTLQVSNLSPLLTVDQLKQIFGVFGTVVDCCITDSKHCAYIEYSKVEETTAALTLNNFKFGGRPLNVELEKSLLPKPAILNSQFASSSLMMQQAVSMQQMQFQQAY